MSGVLPYRGHAPPVDPSAEATQRIPAYVREAPPGLRAAPGTTLRATVIGHDSQGHLLVRSTDGVLALSTHIRPRQGSTVVMQLRPVGAQIQAYILQVIEANGAASAPNMPAAGQAGTAYPGDGDEAAALTRIWPALNEAIKALEFGFRAGSPDDGWPSLLPRSGPTLAAGMLAMIAALLRGDARDWLGAGLRRALAQAGRDDLAQRLENDFAKLSRLARTDSADWRVFVLPILTGGAVRPLRLFLRPPDDSGDSRVARRFIVEAELPQLGPLQLEGLINGNRLELILRSYAPLSDTLRDDLRAAHERAAALGGLSGRLRFAADTSWKFLPVPQAESGTHGVVI
ncbi:hypothetical protein [Ferruginivarius sediminum]|uniref:Flagellar hook-length control protein FliK n=1 Tax=Ferruginivarius sediminum TaxID=2661937 RepID=A0A369TED9_9PROT|nr:hypothetical protein [Ferruginivarius sediminum]RDD63630.1 hypothetical protein DRB17_00135 [Ferruginivarius sediminum]